MQFGVRVFGGIVALAGVVNFLLAWLIGDAIFENLWAVEPLAYIGAVLVMIGLGVITLSYAIPHVVAGKTTERAVDRQTLERWSQVTQQYFELFDHDLGRPLRGILGRERERERERDVRAIMESGLAADPAAKEFFDVTVKGLLDEIERQTPNFRLMMSNIRVLVQLEAPNVRSSSRPSNPLRSFEKSPTAIARWQRSPKKR